MILQSFLFSRLCFFRSSSSRRFVPIELIDSTRPIRPGRPRERRGEGTGCGPRRGRERRGSSAERARAPGGVERKSLFSRWRDDRGSGCLGRRRSEGRDRTSCLCRRGESHRARGFEKVIFIFFVLVGAENCCCCCFFSRATNCKQ